jgi:hypothetical protein
VFEFHRQRFEIRSIIPEFLCIHNGG